MAIDVVVFARKADTPPTLSLCEERISEWRGTVGEGLIKGRAARVANPKTVWREVKRIGGL